jgi:hypothetical protein
MQQCNKANITPKLKYAQNAFKTPKTAFAPHFNRGNWGIKYTIQEWRFAHFGKDI